MSSRDFPYEPLDFPVAPTPLAPPPENSVPFWLGQSWPFAGKWSSANPALPYTLVWESPVFDLHPEQGKGSPNRAVKIWKGGGPGTLFVWARIQAPQALINVTAQELAHPWNLNNLVTVTRPTNITGEITLDKQGALWPFQPPAGMPRYWQVKITFQTVLTSGVLGPPPSSPTVLEAGYY